jgi:hypothetical protein
MKPQDYLALAKAPLRPDRPATRFDFRGVKNDGRRVRLSEFRPGDVIVTDRAEVQILENGAPEVRLKKGYENGRSAAVSGPMFEPVGPSGSSVDANMELAGQRSPFWFRKTVPNHGLWDYKQKGHEYEAFGNFNYGAAGRANRIPAPFLFQEAGLAQWRDNEKRDPAFGSPGIRFLPFSGTRSFGDDPVDQYWIEQGIRRHDRR